MVRMSDSERSELWDRWRLVSLSGRSRGRWVVLQRRSGWSIMPRVGGEDWALLVGEGCAGLCVIVVLERNHDD